MTARLILGRHGNTFSPQDKPVWVGARSDLPLVEKGLLQAQLLAATLKRARIVPAKIIAGPLQRTRQTAAIIAETLLAAPPPQIDARLTEIDYGKWEGKSTDEILALGDADKLAAWDRDSLYPADAGWQPAESRIISNIAALLEENRQGTNIVITSNGILRFFAGAAANAADFPERKVATGNICIMEYSEKNSWYIAQWNIPPEQGRLI